MRVIFRGTGRPYAASTVVSYHVNLEQSTTQVNRHVDRRILETLCFRLGLCLPYLYIKKQKGRVD